MYACRRTTAGFTVLELLVVLAIMGCLMALKIPAIQVNRQKQNQVVALADLQAISAAEASFRLGDSDGDLIDDYGTLAELGAAGLIDVQLASGAKGGYVFDVALTPPPGPDFAARARPQSPKTAGLRFYADSSSVIRFVEAGAPGPASPPLQPGDECTIVPDPPCELLLSNIAVKWLRLVNGLVAGAGIPDVIAFLEGNPTGTLSEDAMDANENGALGLAEILEADLLDVARVVLEGLGLDPGPDVGDDVALRALLVGFQAEVYAALELDVDAPQAELAIGDLPGGLPPVLALLWASVPSVPTLGVLGRALAALALAASAGLALRRSRSV